MKYGARFHVKRFAPLIGARIPRRIISVAYYAYTLTDAIEFARLLKPEYRVGLWIERKGEPATRPLR